MKETSWSLPETGRSQAANLETVIEKNKVDRNAPITSKHVFSKRFAKIIDKIEKRKIPSKVPKGAARYNEFGYIISQSWCHSLWYYNDIKHFFFFYFLFKTFITIITKNYLKENNYKVLNNRNNRHTYNYLHFTIIYITATKQPRNCRMRLILQRIN